MRGALRPRAVSPRPRSRRGRQPAALGCRRTGAAVAGWLAAVGCWLAAIGSGSAQPPAGGDGPVLVSIDGVAAVVGGSEPGDPARTILRSDVELRARMSLLRHDVQRAILGELPSSLLSATLDELLGEQLIAAEAERVQIQPPRPNEIAFERQTIERDSGGRRAVLQLLQRLDASERELIEMARRRALIGAFLRANLEGVTVVTEAEIDQRLRADAARAQAEAQQRAMDPAGAIAPADVPMEAATPSSASGATTPAAQAQLRAAARAAIAKEALTRNIERWVGVLRARTRVRVFAVFESP
jgi:hypothetical protein